MKMLNAIIAGALFGPIGFATALVLDNRSGNHLKNDSQVLPKKTLANIDYNLYNEIADTYCQEYNKDWNQLTDEDFEQIDSLYNNYVEDLNKHWKTSWQSLKNTV